MSSYNVINLKEVKQIKKYNIVHILKNTNEIMYSLKGKDQERLGVYKKEEANSNQITEYTEKKVYFFDGSQITFKNALSQYNMVDYELRLYNNLEAVVQNNRIYIEPVLCEKIIIIDNIQSDYEIKYFEVNLNETTNVYNLIIEFEDEITSNINIDISATILDEADNILTTCQFNISIYVESQIPGEI